MEQLEEKLRHANRTVKERGISPPSQPVGYVHTWLSHSEDEIETLIGELEQAQQREQHVGVAEVERIQQERGGDKLKEVGDSVASSSLTALNAKIRTDRGRAQARLR